MGLLVCGGSIGGSRWDRCMLLVTAGLLAVVVRESHCLWVLSLVPWWRKVSIGGIAVGRGVRFSTCS